MQWTTVAAALLLSCSVAFAQTSTPDIIREVEAFKRSTGTLHLRIKQAILTGRSTAECTALVSEIGRSAAAAQALSSKVSTGLTYESDRNFMRLDAYSAVSKLQSGLLNLNRSVAHLCVPTSEESLDFAVVYSELADSNIEIATVLLDRARK